MNRSLRETSDINDAIDIIQQLAAIRKEQAGGAGAITRRFCENFGYGHHTVRRIERHETDPTLGQLQSYARALGVRLQLTITQPDNS